MGIVKIANMCMINDGKTNKVLVIERKNKWSGIAFPGGHLENGESITQSVVREVFEETGLTIAKPIFCGLKHWYNTQTNERYMVFCFKTDVFTGELANNCDEGEVFWVEIEKLPTLKLARGFKEDLQVFLSDVHFEGFAKWNDKETETLKWT